MQVGPEYQFNQAGRQYDEELQELNEDARFLLVLLGWVPSGFLFGGFHEFGFTLLA